MDKSEIEEAKKELIRSFDNFMRSKSNPDRFIFSSYLGQKINNIEFVVFFVKTDNGDAEKVYKALGPGDNKE